MEIGNVFAGWDRLKKNKKRSENSVVFDDKTCSLDNLDET